jgi:amidase
MASFSTRGVIPVSLSQDVPGPIARNVEDTAMLLEVLMGQSGLVDLCNNDQPLRVGVVRSWLTGHDGTNQLFDDTVTLLAKSGVKISEITISDMPEEAGDDEGIVLLHELVEDLSAYLSNRPGQGVKSLAEVIAFNNENAESELSHFHQDYFTR